jgi:hypothetical protein
VFISPTFEVSVENLFKNPHSEVPDELWKVASPFERQMAAVEYWAELRGVEKIAAKSTVKKRIIDFLADKNTPDLLSAGAGAGIGAGLNLYSTKKFPQSEELEVEKGKFTKEPSREQLDLRADRASLDERKARGNAGPTTEKIQDIKERLASMRAENRLLSTLLMTAGTGALGYGLSRRVRAMT